LSFKYVKRMEEVINYSINWPLFCGFFDI
jgi:hypothetical protein